MVWLVWISIVRVVLVFRFAWLQSTRTSLVESRGSCSSLGQAVDPFTWNEHASFFSSYEVCAYASFSI
ncbi:hypothetical protein IE53DRAFT_391180 [Violaceomyces palustris]|uniref:Uncharacterized protein n=1 Tax=Violaceomyces palustris TaxID=1673888 RepID=A0ACD0NLF2_9BASI|nr:hypothetical protein IE53DRAFT_391180 [Violaceomyces palustris]